MSTPAKVAAFLAALAAVFGVALGIGKLGDPASEPAATHDGSHDSSAAKPAEDAQPPGGLMTSQNGYTFTLVDQQAEPGPNVDVSFTIDGPAGKPVTQYDVEHEKRLHLIAVRRDFTGFQHVHPKLSSTGEWSTKLDLRPGQWRLFADFKPADAEALTLGTDLSVDGDFRPAAVGDESRTAKVEEYTVTLDGELTPGADSRLTLDVSRDGKPVTDLQPYLGAYGHLVALRGGDLAYLHVHPDGTPEDGTTKPGPEVVFHAAVPSSGTYHLYLDFKHDGVVRTAAFTVRTDGPAPAKKGEPTHGHDH